MFNHVPLAYFITWTVYGTFLQGDERGWRKRGEGEQSAQPKLAEWRRERLKHPIELLNEPQRQAVESEIERLADYRGWRLWAKNARSNHVHAVITASSVAGNTVRDQLKANCTRVLRTQWVQFVDRPVWTNGGDWQCINMEEELEQVVLYVSVAQDRMCGDPVKRGTTGR